MSRLVDGMREVCPEIDAAVFNKGMADLLHCIMETPEELIAETLADLEPDEREEAEEIMREFRRENLH